MTMNTDEITDVRIVIADYSDHPDNYNEHPEDQILELMESLRLFGQPRPVVVWHDRFVAGHGVALAARRLGWTHLAARRLPDAWPDHKVTAYLAADNELAKGASPNLQALAALAEQVRQTDTTLARLAAGGALAAAELATMVEQTALSDGKPGAGQRALGDKSHQIKPVLYVDQVVIFERALRATGSQNRGAALTEICQFFLEHHGQADAEGQFNSQAKSSLAALAAFRTDQSAGGA